MKTIARFILAGLVLLASAAPLLAQRPQDNWYLENVWPKTNSPASGGLSVANGVAIGPDGRIYVADQGINAVNVYLKDGTFSFAITNAYGGLPLYSPHGLITDDTGNLYVTVGGPPPRHVEIFTSNGQPIRKIVESVPTNEFVNPMDVAVATNGEIYVVDYDRNCVSVFSQSNSLIRKWGSGGYLDGQLAYPISIAVSRDERVYICQDTHGENNAHRFVKEFTKDGIYVRKYLTQDTTANWNTAASSIRIGPNGNLFLLRAPYQCGGTDWYWGTPRIVVLNPNLTFLFAIDRPEISSCDINNHARGQSHAIGSDGSIIVSWQSTRELWRYVAAHREQRVEPINTYPFPSLVNVRQRSQSPLVDIDYRVTDADDTNVTAAVLLFTNGTQSVGGCLRNPTFVEGTATNIGPGIIANKQHRLTWNAGSDWATTLGNFRVAVLAKDSRTNLLDIHYLRLPADRGMPELKISRSPLIQNDFMQVWWWQLATNDPGIQITSGKIYGVSGVYSNQWLNDGTNTSALGRSYIYGQMRLREATAQEVAWAKEASTPGATNVWSVTRRIELRPLSRNEYGFDTGAWGTNAWWVVPQP